MKITLLIPMYNEEKIIDATLLEVSSYMKETFRDGYEILFVNDGSRDGCASHVEGFPDPCVRLVSYEENRGKGYAIRRGVMEARGDVIIFTDCDLAYGTGVILPFYEVLSAEGGADVAVGSRAKHPDGYRGYSFLRRLVSRAYLFVLRFFGGLKLSDSQCGCKGFRKEMGKRIFSFCEVDRFAFDLEVLMIGKKLGCKIAEMPVKIINHRESTVNLVKDAMRMIRDVQQMKKRIKHQEIK